MKYFTLFSMLAAALLLTACEETVQINDGRIPAEQLAQAAAYAGTFSGYFGAYNSEQANAITLSVENGKAVLRTDRDLLAEECSSKVGDLVSVSFKTDENGVKTLSGADFAFDTGACDLYVTSKPTIHVSFGDKSELDLSLFANSLRWIHCTAGPHGNENCDHRLRGRFVRQ